MTLKKSAAVVWGQRPSWQYWLRWQRGRMYAARCTGQASEKSEAWFLVSLSFKCLKKVGRPLAVSVVRSTESGSSARKIHFELLWRSRLRRIILSISQAQGLTRLLLWRSSCRLPVVGYLAYERGRSQWRWAYVAVIIGPLAIPMLYFVAAKTVSDASRIDGSGIRV
jgi:hypothetical protein